MRVAPFLNRGPRNQDVAHSTLVIVLLVIQRTRCGEHLFKSAAPVIRKRLTETCALDVDGKSLRPTTELERMKILTLNPGGNSLKIELIVCAQAQRYAFEGSKIYSITIEDIGKEATLTEFEGKNVMSRERVDVEDYGGAVKAFLSWRENGPGRTRALEEIDCVGLRVVHGGVDFDKPALVDHAVENKIKELEKLAPLHNKSSIEVLTALRDKVAGTPIVAVFDTCFHRTMPEAAYRYAIPVELANKRGIRRFGFHGISHRYLLDRYAYLAGKDPSECSVVTMHLESGCSLSAIRAGRSIDNSMGMTPLEGLMMGTRSGDIDPSVIALLMDEEGMTIGDVMVLLNKQSGLLGVSGTSLDTRVLMKQYESDGRAKLAMDIYAYRVRKAVGAYLAALGEAEAVVFGGAIAEDTPFVRQQVCEGLKGFGLEEDREVNRNLIDREGRVTRDGSRIAGWVILAQEGLQIAHECLALLR